MDQGEVESSSRAVSQDKVNPPVGQKASGDSGEKQRNQPEWDEAFHAHHATAPGRKKPGGNREWAGHHPRKDKMIPLPG
jgi:hypothetical protein